MGLLQRIASGEQAELDEKIEKLYVERRRWDRDPGYAVREAPPRRSRARWLDVEDERLARGERAGKEIGR